MKPGSTAYKVWDRGRVTTPSSVSLSIKMGVTTPAVEGREAREALKVVEGIQYMLPKG